MILLHVRARLPTCKLPLAAVSHRLSGSRQEGTALFMIQSSVKDSCAIWRIPVTGLPLPSQADDTYMTLAPSCNIPLLEKQVFHMQRVEHFEGFTAPVLRGQNAPKTQPTPRTTARCTATQVYTSRACMCWGCLRMGAGLVS